MLDAVDTTLSNLERDYVSQEGGLEGGLDLLKKQKQELVELKRKREDGEEKRERE